MSDRLEAWFEGRHIGRPGDCSGCRQRLLPTASVLQVIRLKKAYAQLVDFYDATDAMGEVFGYLIPERNYTKQSNPP